MSKSRSACIIFPMQWKFANPTTLSSLDLVKTSLIKTREIFSPKTFFSPPCPREWTDSDSGITMAQIQDFRDLLTSTKGKILIYGDYDADGILASVIMSSVLDHLSISNFVYLPDRRVDGYGMSPDSLSKILNNNPDISTVITVDQGIKAHAAVDFLKSHAINVVITDHHTPDVTFPNANLIIYSTKICGSAVAYFLTRHLATKAINELNLQFAAIGTVTDVMPLTDINRNLVFHGLKLLNHTTHIGLQTLISISQLDPHSLETYHLGFQIGPRLNAVGRMANPRTAFELLKSTRSDEAFNLAAALNDTNHQRQQLTEQMVTQALDQIDPTTKILITHNPQYDEGIIGLIAGKLTQQFHKPSLAITSDGAIAKGSARSIKGINIVEILEQVSHLLSAYGGHEQAGGFTLPIENLNQFIDLINQIAKEIPESDLQKTLNIDALLPFSLINSYLISTIEQFAPFGHGNPKPIFATPQVTIVQVSSRGSSGQHRKIVVKHDHVLHECLSWNHDQSRTIEPGQLIDLAYTVKSSFYRSQQQISLELIDWH